jgi:hypothetical protein
MKRTCRSVRFLRWLMVAEGRLARIILTRAFCNRNVSAVSMLRYMFVCGLTVALLGGGVPYFGCSPAVCAASSECAMIHCACCGPTCPMNKDSRHSDKGTSHCNDQCPRTVSKNTATITNVRSHALLMSLAMASLLPFQSCSTNASSRPIRNSPDLDPSTLLRLCCALTT